MFHGPKNQESPYLWVTMINRLSILLWSFELGTIHQMCGMLQFMNSLLENGLTLASASTNRVQRKWHYVTSQVGAQKAMCFHFVHRNTSFWRQQLPRKHSVCLDAVMCEKDQISTYGEIIGRDPMTTYIERELSDQSQAVPVFLSHSTL